MVIEIGLGEWTRHPQLVIAYHLRRGKSVYNGRDAGMVKQGIEPLICIPVTESEAELWTQDIPDNRYRVVAGG